MYQVLETKSSDSPPFVTQRKLVPNTLSKHTIKQSMSIIFRSKTTTYTVCTINHSSLHDIFTCWEYVQRSLPNKYPDFWLNSKIMYGVPQLGFLNQIRCASNHSGGTHIVHSFLVTRFNSVDTIWCEMPYYPIIWPCGTYWNLQNCLWS